MLVMLILTSLYWQPLHDHRRRIHPANRSGKRTEKHMS